ncbi:MAG: lytic murein transglycosylase [Pseudomonadota bacterium]
MTSIATIASILVFSASTVAAQCGGGFNSFVNGLAQEAVNKGHGVATVQRFFQGVSQDPSVIRADRSQGVFQKNFLDFSRALISSDRMTKGRQNADRYANVFRAMRQQYGVDPGVLLAFWAFETDFGVNQGNFNTRNALVTLAHDCRRPELFRPQVFAAIELFERGGFDPQNTKGAWAGEIGMIQMLPEDLLRNGVDADGNGRVDLQTSAPDALMTGARMLSQMGWRPNEPWLQEVTVPANLDWSLTGLDKTLTVADWANRGVRARSGQLFGSNTHASILLPMGRNGPAFIAYPNFNVYFEWNKSFVYVTTAAYFATRLTGAPVYNAGSPDQGLNGQQMQQLQQRLQARGHDVGAIDGILGAKTRAAVQREQQRLGLPADAWPTPALLGAL